jgi:hypothetical protein
MTSKRMRFLKELFDFMGLGGRLRLEWISSAEAQKFVKVMSEFTEEIHALGPNPLCQYTFESGRKGKQSSGCLAAGLGLKPATEASPGTTKRTAAGG